MTNDAIAPLDFLRGLPKIPLGEANLCKYPELKQIGIYAIFVESNGKIYIGSASRSFLRRMQKHMSSLKRDLHHASGLQNAVNKYGLECLTFSLVESLNVDYEALLACEQKWIDAIPTSLRLNICLVAGSPLGRPYPESSKVRQSIRMKELFEREPERVQKMIDGTKEWMKNDDNRDARSQRGRDIMANPVHREKLRLSAKDPVRRSKISVSMKLLWTNPQHRLLVSAAMKSEWADPLTRSRRSEAIRRGLNTAEHKQKVSNQFKELFKDPEYRQRNLEHLTRTNRANAQNTSDRFTKLWADEDYKKKLAQKNTTAHASKNSPSIIISPDGIEYVADSISQFAKKFSLSQSLLNRVVRGDQNNHKGWTGYKIDSWGDVPDDAIRVLWAEHDDLPIVKQPPKPLDKPVQLAFVFD